MEAGRSDDLWKGPLLVLRGLHLMIVDEVLRSRGGRKDRVENPLGGLAVHSDLFADFLYEPDVVAHLLTLQEGIRLAAVAPYGSDDLGVFIPSLEQVCRPGAGLDVAGYFYDSCVSNCHCVFCVCVVFELGRSGHGRFYFGLRYAVKTCFALIHK